jgi:Protein of unknown function (DUF1569)
MNSILHTLQLEIACSLRLLDAGQTQLRPPQAPNRWNIQQIMEHLLLTYSAAGTGLSTRIAKHAPTKATPTLKNRIQQFATLNLGYIPAGRPAPTMVVPPSAPNPQSGLELTHAANQGLSNFDAICAEAEGLFGANRCATHMVLGPLSVDQWRMFQLVHGRHHLKQIAAIRKAHNL